MTGLGFRLVVSIPIDGDAWTKIRLSNALKRGDLLFADGESISSGAVTPSTKC
jgi:hypothetical protein